MFNLFGNGCRSGEGNSTILWFIILVILLFMNNDNGNGCCVPENHCC